ncbi:ABC transporter permease [Spirilliplanes yamanashiensis]|uniref:Transport permease protein n=1 Tax=Spirilliplanes yamanashiensis TaxID=42233 RepID=A0A8J4DM70_9ACTN|nr:ABC transporter permease [Spirilliplanes yamanashiensis]MDP9818226.1 ABC-type multidrug transport system permease subunit [Spirilliplanes yamanashiensis]GIJ06746.1 hypothetical protein Sya03_60980 [Spirilliplanes yamanashiensis]
MTVLPAARRPGVADLLAAQTAFALRDLWRTRVVFIFTFLFPLTWLVVLGFLVGDATADGTGGVPVMQYVTPTAAVMGVLYGAYPTVAVSLADARERGVLKRVRGTPVPAAVYLAGRVGAAVVFALGSVLTMLAAGVLVYDVRIVWRTVPASLATVVVALVCFAAAGMAVATTARSAAVAQAASIGSAVVIGFVSGVLAWGDMPGWADRIAAFFPLKPFNDALQAQFDPGGAGSGWDPGALAVMAAWAVGAGVLAARAFRWDPAARGGRADPPPPRRPAARRRPAVTVTARPGGVALLLGQAGWATRAAVRDVGWVFFAVAMPVGLYAFTAAVVPASPGGTTRLAAGMIAWGALVTAFVNMPEAVARARDRGVLKRLRGTPLRPAVHVAGRIVAVLWIALLTGGLVVLAGVSWFGVRPTAAGLLWAAGWVVVGTATLAACGLALASALPDSRTVTAVALGISLPVAFFSDVFAIDATPAWMSAAGSVLPLRHLVTLVAAALDPGGPTAGWTAPAVLLAWLVGAGFVAVRTFRWSGRR